MDAPPSYTNQVDPSRDRLPPYRAKHAFANSAEELAALKEFAESKMYVQPGSGGTLPDLRGGGGIKTMVWGGPMQGQASEERGWPAPETAEEKKRRKEADKMRKQEERVRKGSVGERLKRVISGSGGKEEGTGSGSSSRSLISERWRNDLCVLGPLLHFHTICVGTLHTLMALSFVG